MTVNVSIPDRFPIRDMLKFEHRYRSRLTVIDGDMKNILAIQSLEMTDNLMNRSAVLVRAGSGNLNSGISGVSA
jgi:hypothetical protein